MRTGGNENIHGKEANSFYLMVPKLENLKNKRGEKSKIIIHLAKKKLWQEQEKATKTNKHQSNSKQKQQN